LRVPLRPWLQCAAARKFITGSATLACQLQHKSKSQLARETYVSRTILESAQIHPAIRETVGSQHADVVREVQAAAAANNVLVVGMRKNPYPKRARKALDAAGVAYKYLEYGSYFTGWRPRLALKMWSGWSTFPMIFIKGMLIGGAEDLETLIKSGELKKLLS
jgi:glutaredoxin-related protein